MLQWLEDIAVTSQPLTEWMSAVEKKLPHNPHVRFNTDLISAPVLPSSRFLSLSCSPSLPSFPQSHQSSESKAQTDVFTQSGDKGVGDGGGDSEGFPDDAVGGLQPALPPLC